MFKFLPINMSGTPAEPNSLKQLAPAWGVGGSGGSDNFFPEQVGLKMTSMRGQNDAHLLTFGRKWLHKKLIEFCFFVDRSG